MKLYILFPIIALSFAIISADFENFDLEHNYKSILFIVLATVVFVIGKWLIIRKKNKVDG